MKIRRIVKQAPKYKAFDGNYGQVLVVEPGEDVYLAEYDDDDEDGAVIYPIDGNDNPPMVVPYAWLRTP
jgi:hypothetical protein